MTETNVPRFEPYEPKKELTQAEKEFWLEESARQEVYREDHQFYADQARENRDRALERLGLIRRLGMIGIDNSKGDK